MEKKEKEEKKLDRFQLGQIVGDAGTYIIDTKRENAILTDQQAILKILNTLDQLMETLA